MNRATQNIPTLQPHEDLSYPAGCWEPIVRAVVFSRRFSASTGYPGQSRRSDCVRLISTGVVVQREAHDFQRKVATRMAGKNPGSELHPKYVFRASHSSWARSLESIGSLSARVRSVQPRQDYMESSWNVQRMELAPKSNNQAAFLASASKASAKTS